VVDPEEILAEVRRTDEESGGQPLGRSRFAEATRSPGTVWGRYWVRWSGVCV